MARSFWNYTLFGRDKGYMVILSRQALENLALSKSQMAINIICEIMREYCYEIREKYENQVEAAIIKHQRDVIENE